MKNKKKTQKIVVKPYFILNFFFKCKKYIPLLLLLLLLGKRNVRKRKGLNIKLNFYAHSLCGKSDKDNL